MSATENMVPVSPILLNVLEERLCDVSAGIAGIAEVLGSITDVSHLQFVSDALMGALAEKMGHCFNVLSEGRLLKTEREIAEAHQ